MNSHDQALYELMSERYDGLQANCDTLRASLGRVERRNEELDLALEVARQERDEAKTRSDFFEKEAMNWGHQNATLVVQRDAALVAQRERDAIAVELAGRALAAEVALVTIAAEVARKAGEADGLALLVGELRAALEKIADDGVERSRDWRTLTAQAALALPLPGAAKKAAAERTFMLHDVGESGGWISGATEIYRERQDARRSGASALDEAAVLRGRVGELKALLRTMGISA